LRRSSSVRFRFMLELSGIIRLLFLRVATFYQISATFGVRQLAVALQPKT
jgi:hypothetical protein